MATAREKAEKEPARARRLPGEGSVRARPDGRWEVRLSVGGHRRSFYAPDQEAALRLLAELRGKQLAGRLPQPTTLTVGEFITEWLGTHGAALRPGTVESYRVKLARLGPLFGLRLGRLEARHLAATYAALRGRGLAPATVRATHAVVHKALADAVRWGLLPQNPAAAVTPPPAPPRALAWGLAEARAFVAHCRQEDTPQTRLFTFLVWSGLRLGEALALQWQDVRWDPAGVVVRVERQLSRLRSGYAEGLPKTAAGRRAFSLPPPVADVLKRQRAWQERVGIPPRPDQRLWVTAHNTPLDRAALRRSLDRLCRRAGLPALRVHDLRAVHATVLVVAGVDIKEVQRRLGHASLRMTLGVYAKPVPESDGPAAVRLAQTLNGANGARELPGTITN